MAAKFMLGIDCNSNRAQHLADGTAADDAVTLQQLQALVRGLAWKVAVRAATTATGTLATAFANGSTIDGVSLATGDRILLKNQSSGGENGIYTVNASGAPTRATDADSTVELRDAAVFVSEGSVNADLAFVQTAEITTVGTTAQVWVQFGGASIYTAGNGLALAGGAFSILLDTGSGMSVSGSGLKIDTAVVVRKFAANCVATTNPQTFAHTLGTADLVVSVYESGVKRYPDISVDSTNVTVDWGGAPTSAQYRVVVHG